jgi:hypothetical protein
VRQEPGILVLFSRLSKLTLIGSVLKFSVFEYELFPHVNFFGVKALTDSQRPSVYKHTEHGKLFTYLNAKFISYSLYLLVALNRRSVVNRL